MRSDLPTEIPALKVKQWTPEWDDIEWEPSLRQAEPALRHFFIFSIEARTLKRLTGIQRRSTREFETRADDLGIQRFHDKERSDTIRDFVRYGYPWSELPKAKRRTPGFERFRKPGWLPTGIIVNLLGPSAQRGSQSLAPSDQISVIDGDETRVSIRLPAGAQDAAWEPKDLPPIEVIDGQHRLWAFDESAPPHFELPVIAFYDLDISWQAYLFWSINITPKRINRSLAFDLYPLLRTEDWLDESLGGHRVYRETRAQELVETLYAHPLSPWYKRINMLGQTRSQSGDARPLVSQNAWINSLLATLVKNWEPKRKATGGLFGSKVGEQKSVLQWNKAQQSAFLIWSWTEIKRAVEQSQHAAAKSLKDSAPAGADPILENPHSLLTTDQGVRGVLAVINDLCYVDADRLVLSAWRMLEVTEGYDEGAVTVALRGIENHHVAGFLRSLARELANYDWRTSSAPDLSEEERRNKTALRGGSGYRVLRSDLLRLLSGAGGAVGSAAKRVIAGDDA